MYKYSYMMTTTAQRTVKDVIEVYCYKFLTLFVKVIIISKKFDYYELRKTNSMRVFIKTLRHWSITKESIEVIKSINKNYPKEVKETRKRNKNRQGYRKQI